MAAKDVTPEEPSVAEAADPVEETDPSPAAETRLLPDGVEVPVITAEITAPPQEEVLAPAPMIEPAGEDVTEFQPKEAVTLNESPPRYVDPDVPESFTLRDSLREGWRDRDFLFSPSGTLGPREKLHTFDLARDLIIALAERAGAIKKVGEASNGSFFWTVKDELHTLIAMVDHTLWSKASRLCCVLKNESDDPSNPALAAFIVNPDTYEIPGHLRVYPSFTPADLKVYGDIPAYVALYNIHRGAWEEAMRRFEISVDSKPSTHRIRGTEGKKIDNPFIPGTSLHTATLAMFKAERAECPHSITDAHSISFGGTVLPRFLFDATTPPPKEFIIMKRHDIIQIFGDGHRIFSCSEKMLLAYGG